MKSRKRETVDGTDLSNMKTFEYLERRRITRVSLFNDTSMPKPSLKNNSNDNFNSSGTIKQAEMEEKVRLP